jgi:hypothetical protein
MNYEASCDLICEKKGRNFCTQKMPAEDDDCYRCQSTDLPLSSLGSTADDHNNDDIISLREPRPQTIRQLLRFQERPPRQLCQFYWYLIAEHAEENLEFLLCLRNHRILHHRFRINHSDHQNDIINDNKPRTEDTNVELLSGIKSKVQNNLRQHEYQVSPEYLARPITTLITGLPDLCNGSADDINVDEQMLRQSAEFIYTNYLAVGSLKEVNIPRHLGMDIYRRLTDSDGCDYSPRLFHAVGKHVLLSLQLDSYPRFRASRVHCREDFIEHADDYDLETVSAETSIVVEPISADTSFDLGDRLTLSSGEHLTMIDNRCDDKDLPELPADLSYTQANLEDYIVEMPDERDHFPAAATDVTIDFFSTDASTAQITEENTIYSTKDSSLNDNDDLEALAKHEIEDSEIPKGKVNSLTNETSGAIGKEFEEIIEAKPTVSESAAVKEGSETSSIKTKSTSGTMIIH